MEGLTAVILVQVFPPQQRGLALGLRSIGWAVGELLFYTLGGYLFEHISWRWLFFLGIPSGIATIVLGLLVLPKQSEVRDPTVDSPGLLLLGGFLVPLLLVISFGRNSETSLSTLIMLGLGACIGGGALHSARVVGCLSRCQSSSVSAPCLLSPVLLRVF
jgi:MFS family permease